MSKRRKQKLTSELFSTTIESLSHEGRGITHIDGKTTFIRNALPEETITFKYLSKKRAFDAAIAIEILKSSATRVTPACPHFNMCGGCCLQHMHNEAQIQHKQQVLIDQLQHFGKIKPQEILPPLTGSIWEYRHKARLGVRFVAKKAKVLIGFREINGRYITDISSCKILHATVGNKIAQLQELIATLNNFKAIPQIEVAAGDNQTALVIRHLQPLPQTDIDKLIAFAKLHNFAIYLQSKGIDTAHKIWPINTPARLSYHLPLHDVTLFFHPCDFTQINLGINRNMIDRVITLLDVNKTDTILDLFCGLGNFTIPLAKLCKHIIGIEGAPKMVQRAQENMQYNQINNANFYCTNLSESVAKFAWTKQNYAKILLDPPRSGALEIIKNFAGFETAKNVVYVSCNPATLARDASILVHEHGYTLQKIGVMDMFPHTAHVESIALFNK